MMCDHVYKTTDTSLCPKCGLESHDINWAKENKLREEWLLANPNAKYGGWISI